MEPLHAGDPEEVGGYRLLGRLGSGGMGRVYLGISPGGRKVAVKLVHPALAADSLFRERFAREVEAARRVGGFHTAPVVDADPGADQPFMVTAFIDGLSLQKTVRENGPLPSDQVRELAAGLAEGLAAIHRAGLVHRDLKPANVVMGADGPRIIDFGIAHIADATTLTSAGEIMGSCAYMSPEQATGQDAGPASDVFSLGGVLAFAATGRPPFGTSVAGIVQRISREKPDLSRVTDTALRDLIARCLTKDAAARPAPETVLTGSTGPSRMAPSLAATRWPKIALIAVMCAVSLATFYTLSTGQRGRVASPGGSARADRTASAARAPWDGGVPLRDPGTAGASWVAFSPGGKLLGVADQNGHAYLWGVASGKLLRTLGDGRGKGVWDVDFSRYGTYLAAAEYDRYVPVWDVRTGRLAATLTGPPGGGGLTVAFCPDGKLIAAGDGKGDVLLWRVPSWRPVVRPLADPGRRDIGWLVFSPDGGLLAASDLAGRTFLWNVATGKLVTTLTDPRGQNIYGASFSRDGKMLAVADANGNAYIWTVATGRLIATMPDPASSGVDGVVFSPDGRLIAISDMTGFISLWNVSHGTMVASVLDQDSKGVPGVAFSPDGRLLATSDNSGAIHLRQVAQLLARPAP